MHVAVTWNNGAYVVYVDGARWKRQLQRPEDLRVGRQFRQRRVRRPLRGVLRHAGRGAGLQPGDHGGGSEAGLQICPRPRSWPRSRFPRTKTANVPPASVLAWTAGEYAATHDVYFGTSFDDVNNAAGPSRGRPSQPGPDDEAVRPRRPARNSARPTTGGSMGQRRSRLHIFKGDGLELHGRAYAYPGHARHGHCFQPQPGMGPENTINGSGLTDDRHSTELSRCG